MQLSITNAADDTLNMAPCRSSGLKRLNDFLPRAGRDYATGRNFDLGPSSRHNVSMLSPYLRHRLITEEEVLRVVIDFHGLESGEKFVQEVFWRTYFKGWLQQRPIVWQRYQEELLDNIRRLHDDGSLSQRYEQAVDGKTGIDCFDAWSRELVETGYLHNHARMWFASIWVYTLGLPWQLGADFFYRYLLDGDPASNTLSWRWVCGLHTRGKTYLACADNIKRYTRGRFNPRGQLATQAPALEDALGGATLTPLTLSTAEYRRADGRAGLLVTEEDCLPETLDLHTDPVAVLGLTATEARSPLEIGEPARHFARGAVSDALRRCERRLGVGVNLKSSSDWSTSLLDWARENRLKRIETVKPPVGPVAALLQSAAPTLAAAGIDLIQLDRRYDLMAWPHATRGFFGLKRKIPQILSGLRISQTRQLDLVPTMNMKNG